MRGDHHDLRSGNLPRTFTPPKPVPQRSMRYVIKINHAHYLLPTELTMQEAAGIAYLLGQSRRIESRYVPGGSRADWIPLESERPEIGLSILDPKDIVEAAPREDAP